MTNALQLDLDRLRLFIDHHKTRIDACRYPGQCMTKRIMDLSGNPFPLVVFSNLFGQRRVIAQLLVDLIDHIELLNNAFLLLVLIDHETGDKAKKDQQVRPFEQGTR